MKPTQKQIIVEFLKANPKTWFKSYELRGRDTPFGFCGHQADRRARELAEAGEILVRHENKYAEYHTKEVEIIKTTYRPDFIKSLVEKKGRELQSSMF